MIATILTISLVLSPSISKVERQLDLLRDWSNSFLRVEFYEVMQFKNDSGMIRSFEQLNQQEKFYVMAMEGEKLSNALMEYQHELSSSKVPDKNIAGKMDQTKLEGYLRELQAIRVRTAERFEVFIEKSAITDSVSKKKNLEYLKKVRKWHIEQEINVVVPIPQTSLDQ